jgi:hypothetical protein
VLGQKSILARTPKWVKEAGPVVVGQLPITASHVHWNLFLQRCCERIAPCCYDNGEWAYQYSTFVTPANINTLAVIAAILGAPLNAKAKPVPSSARRARAVIHQLEERSMLTPNRSAKNRIAKTDQQRNVKPIDVTPRALRQFGSVRRKFPIQPR